MTYYPFFRPNFWFPFKYHNAENLPAFSDYRKSQAVKQTGIRGVVRIQVQALGLLGYQLLIKPIIN